MSVLRNILDHALRGWLSVTRYRRAHPCETAAEFRALCVFWSQQGRPVLANIYRRKAARWDARCPSK